MLPFRISAILLAATIFAPALAPSPAVAQESGSTSMQDLSTDEKKKLKLLVDSAKENYSEGNFEKAIPFLEKAYELYPNPAFLYRTALAYERSGHPDEAITYYKRYLAEKPDTSKRGQVERTIERLEQQVAQRQRDESEDEDRTASKSDPDGQQDGDGDEQTEPAPESGSSDGPDTLTLAFTGAGAASTAAAVTFGVLFAGADADFDQKRNQFRDMPRSDKPARNDTNINSLRTRRNSLLTATYISLGLAAATAGTAAYLWLRPEKPASSTSADSGRASPSIGLAITPTSVGISGRF